MTDTIVARATGAPPAAIAIVRLSGPGVRAVADALVGRVPVPRRATRVTLRDPATGERLDDGLALFFPAPRSATGEDVLELHIHGGRAVGAAVERACRAQADVRLAEPGEFTRRAVANGRLDLMDAEALGELLAAETETQRRAAEAGGSHLKVAVDRWQTEVLAISAQVEAAIDHEEAIDIDALGSRVRLLLSSIEALLARPSLDRIRDGFRVVIAGPPNAGKSTLFNALLGDEAAIVSPIAGTTRDILDRVVQLGDVAIRLIDTAGQRSAGTDPIEAIGIARAEAETMRADLILWMSDEPSPRTADVIRVRSRADLIDEPGSSDVLVSALTGAGVDRLMRIMSDRLKDRMPPPGDPLVNARQRTALGEVSTALRRAAQADDLALFAADLADARSAMDRLTGRAGVEDLLDTIFSGFCLGK